MTSNAKTTQDHRRPLPIVRLVEAAGTTQTDAISIQATWAKVTSVPAGSGVRLPPTLIGLEVEVVRADHDTVNDLLVYPSPGDMIGDDMVVKLDGDYPSSVRFLNIDGVWDVPTLQNGSRWARTFPKLAGLAALALGSLAFRRAGVGALAGNSGAALGPVTIRSASGGPLAGASSISLGPAAILSAAASIGALQGSGGLTAAAH